MQHAENIHSGAFRSGTDALLLVAYALRHAPKTSCLVELGCGDGLAMHVWAKVMMQGRSNGPLRMLGIDMDAEALAMAEGRELFPQVSRQTLCMDVGRRKDVLSACADLDFAHVSCVLMNPPYYKGGRPSPKIQRNMALHTDSEGNEDVLQNFCATARSLLDHHGWLFCIYGAAHVLDVTTILQRQGFGIRGFLPVHTRPGKDARWALVAARKGAATQLAVEPALTLYARAKGERMSRAALEFCPWL